MLCFAIAPYPVQPPTTWRLALGAWCVVLGSLFVCRFYSYLIIYQVRHKQTGFIRACKTIKIHNRQDADLLNTEIAVMKQLDHPNVVKLYQYYYDKSSGNMYLIMEYCEGGSILDVLQNDGSVPADTVASYTQQILSALCYCHRKKLVHRDIKPDNILLINQGQHSSFGSSDAYYPQGAAPKRP